MTVLPSPTTLAPPRAKRRGAGLKALLDHAPAGVRLAARSLYHRVRALTRLPSVFRRTADYFAACRTEAAVPRTLYVELTNICNSDCVFCMYRHDTHAKGRMTPETFRRVVDQFVAAGGKRLGLTPMTGDLLVHPQALELAAYARSRGIRSIYANTNGILLDKFGTDAVLTCGLTKLSISMAPPDEALYEAMYRNRHYRRVMANVERLLQAFHAHPGRVLRELVIEVRADRPEAEVRALPDFRRVIAPYEHSGVTVQTLTHYDSWTGTITEADMLPGMTLLTATGSRFRPPCHRAFYVKVSADGRIRQCGNRIDLGAAADELLLGHVDDMTVAQAFNSPCAQAMVKSFYNGRPLEVCRKCTWYAVN